MAAFNPDVGGVPNPNMPDQTGASRGVDANRSFDYLFRGVGDAVGGVAKAVDSDIKTTITNEAKGVYETTMDPYTKTIPAELESSGAAMKNLQTAFEQGKISDTYYYGQLTTLTKKMRSKYPGYEDFVDDTIMDVTGVRPANSYRNALMSQFADEANAASDSIKFDRAWVKENEEYIYRIAPDYYENPGKYDLNMVKNEVGKLKATDSTISSQKAEVEYLLSQNTLDDQRATEVATTTLNQTVSNVMNGLGNTFGFNTGDFLKTVQQLGEGGYSDEEYNQIAGQLNMVETNLRLALDKQFTEPLTPGSTNSFSSVLPGKKKEMIEEALAPFAAIKQMVTDKELGLAGYYTRMLTISNSEETSRILNASPELKTAMALKDISTDLATQFINESGKQVGIFKDIAPEISARVLNGQDTMNGAVDRVVNTATTSDNKVGFINSTLDNLTGAIASGEATPDQITNAVGSLYALDSQGKDIFSYVNPNEYMRLYNRMFNPQLTQAIVANGTPEDLQTYFEAARARIYAVPEFKQAASNFGDINASWKDYFEVKLDESGHFSLNVKQDGVPLVDFMGNQKHSGLLGGWEYSSNKKTAETSINALNNVLDNLGNIAEAMGETDKVGIYGQVLKDLNVNLEQGESGGFFKWLMDFVPAMAGADESSLEEDINAVGNQIGFDVPGNTEEAASYEMGNTGDVITDTIIGFEGFSATAYDDNGTGTRAGYGSDTVTTASGEVRPVTSGTKVSKEDAARDLNRRLTTEFIPGVVEDIGQDVWAELTPNQQTALASLAYNYGSLPTKVVKAIKKGEPQEVAEAIRSLGTHNNGINRKRRNKEAELYLG